MPEIDTFMQIPRRERSGRPAPRPDGWAGWLFGALDLAMLRGAGVDRIFGAKISGWLMHAEAGVRRLILAAALAVTPPAMRRAVIRTTQHVKLTAPRRTSFRVFGLCGTGAARPSTPRPPQPMRPYAHILFRADPLLRLGAAPRTIEDRRCAWRPPEDRWRPEPDDGIMSFIERDPAPPRTRKPRPPYNPNAMPESASDWRRCYDDWQKLVPAPRHRRQRQASASRAEPRSRAYAPRRSTITLSQTCRPSRSRRTDRGSIRQGPRRTRPPRHELSFHHRKSDEPAICVLTNGRGRTTIPAHPCREAMRGPGLEPRRGGEGQGGDGH